MAGPIRPEDSDNSFAAHCEGYGSGRVEPGWSCVADAVEHYRQENIKFAEAITGVTESMNKLSKLFKDSPEGRRKERNRLRYQRRYARRRKE